MIVPHNQRHRGPHWRQILLKIHLPDLEILQRIAPQETLIAEIDITRTSWGLGDFGQCVISRPPMPG
jgi:hypothetical protein